VGPDCELNAFYYLRAMPFRETEPYVEAGVNGSVVGHFLKRGESVNISFPGIEELAGSFKIADQTRASFDACRYAFVPFAVVATAMALPAAPYLGAVAVDFGVKWTKEELPTTCCAKTETMPDRPKSSLAFQPVGTKGI
jgi:hypothetical protein